MNPGNTQHSKHSGTFHCLHCYFVFWVSLTISKHECQIGSENNAITLFLMLFVSCRIILICLFVIHSPQLDYVTLKFCTLPSVFKSSLSQCRERKKRLGISGSDFLHDLGQLSTQLTDLFFPPSQFLKTFFSLMCWYHELKLHYCQKACHRNLAKQQKCMRLNCYKNPLNQHWGLFQFREDCSTSAHRIPTMHIRREHCSPDLTKSQTINSLT